MNKVRAEHIDHAIETINNLVETLNVIRFDEHNEFTSMPEALRAEGYVKSSQSADHLSASVYRLNMVIESLDYAKGES